MSQTVKDVAKPSAERKPYTPPRVISYGHVKDVIQGGLGKKADGPGVLSKTTCWIAEVLYGVTDPRTLLLRASLTAAYEQRRPGWMCIALYRRFGEATANLIARGYLPRQLFQPLFDRLVENALAEWAIAVAANRR
jgi:hypothetical protein